MRNRIIVILTVILISIPLAAAEVQLTALTLQEGKPIDLIFAKTTRAPSRATMNASLNFEKGQASIDLRFEKMEPAVLFSGDIAAYVLWAVTIDGTTDNLGEVLVDRKNCSGSQRYFTPKKIFALMVTAEPLATVSRPTEYILFTSGEVRAGQVINTPFRFSNFRTGPRPALETISGIQYNDDTPVAVKQAEKALAMADKINAAAVNPVAVRDAKAAYAKSLGLVQVNGSKKEIADFARTAVQLASQAIVDTTRAAEAKAAAEAEAKRQAERAALEQRATAAETESQRIARELREVQVQREALASESRNLAQLAEKLTAERNAAAAEREAIKKERDELAGMLKGALSTVAETNETARGVIVSLPGILFDLNKATLKEPAQLTVAKLAGILMVFRNMNLSIEGHTDSTGTDEFNMKLSTERAKSVYDFLRNQGIPVSRMAYQGFGSSTPVAPNDSEADRAKNRRVEVVLTQASKPPSQEP